MDMSNVNRTMPGAYGTNKAPQEMTDEKSAFLKAAKGASGSEKSGVGMIPLSPVQTAQQQLGNAISHNDTQAVEDLIRDHPSGLDFSAPLGRGGGAALHGAVVYGDSDIVHQLVDQAGVDMAKLNNDGKSAYQVADAKAKKSGDPADRATADWLRGRMTDELKRAALDGNYNRAVELVNAGADASILPGGELGTREQFTNTDNTMASLLNGAIMKGDTQAVQALLEAPPKGWDINAMGSGGTGNLLQDVVRSGGANHSNEGTIRALIDNDSIDRAKLDASGSSAYQVLESRAKETHDPVLQRDADFLRDKMNGELGRAVFDGDQARATALLKAGADPKAAINGDPEKSKGFTLLMYAAANKEPDTVKAMLDALPPDERKAFVNQKDDTGSTALHAAAFGGDDATYKTLVEAGGDETVKDGQGQTPKDVSGNLKKRGTSDPSAFGAVPILGNIYMAWRLYGGNDIQDIQAMPNRPIDPANPGANLPSATQQFTDNPMQYADTHFLGYAGAAPGSNFRPENGQAVDINVAPTTPGARSPGRPGLGGDAPGAAINLTPSANPRSPGPNAATWLDFQNGRDTTITVPAHPSGNDPRFVMTPAVTGCAFYATDNHDGTITFHHRSYPGQGEQNQGVPSGAVGIGYGDYGPHLGAGGDWDPEALGNLAGGPGSTHANGVAPFAYYDGDQWVIQGQTYQTNMAGPNTLEPFDPQTGEAGLNGFRTPVVFPDTKDKGAKPG